VCPACPAISEGQHGTPDTRWFEGGRLNASVNCVDRHARSHRANKTAIIWESDDGKSCQSVNTRRLLGDSECTAVSTVTDELTDCCFVCTILVRKYTFKELHVAIQRAANALRALGVRKGTTVALYMPMVPEAVIAMLACARLGAPHNTVFAVSSRQRKHAQLRRDWPGAKAETIKAHSISRMITHRLSVLFLCRVSPRRRFASAFTRATPLL